jgi:hypothetical protein
VPVSLRASRVGSPYGASSIVEPSRGIPGSCSTCRVVFEPIGDASPNGVPVDIPEHLHQIAVRIEEDRFVSAAKQGAVSAMGAVEVLGVEAVEVSQAPREIPFRALE